ncbi:MAG: thermonuclease family protein [Sphingomicrobium sp.]
MSKHWKPGKTTVKLEAAARPSRIRREPVAINANVAAKPQRPVNIRERDLFLGIAGILIFAAAIGAMIIAIAAYTVFHDDPEAEARAAQFNQCYLAAGPNCVADGDTIYVGGHQVEIAGIEAPAIAEAKCDIERDRGIEAATMLAMILNSGAVTVGAPFRDQSGRIVHKVEVKGRDVALRMVDQDLAHEVNSGLTWCH